MRYQAEGWMNECVSAAEQVADLVAYELLVDGASEGYVTATCDPHAVNKVKKYHDVVFAEAGQIAGQPVVFARRKS